MIVSVLIVDDSESKIDNVRRFLVELETLFEVVFVVEVARSSSYAVNLLGSRHFDVMLVDLFLPTRDDAPPTSNGGADLLRITFRGRKNFVPDHIIALTAHPKLRVEQRDMFEKHGVVIAEYSPSAATSWKTILESIAHTYHANNGAPRHPQAISASDGAVGATRPENRSITQTPRYRWLHLSDMHLGGVGSSLWEDIEHKLSRSLREWIPKVGAPHLVLFSGDLTDRAKTEQFDDLSVFLTKILDLIEKLSDDKIRPLLIPVPGNHDLTRPDLVDYAAFERYVEMDKVAQGLAAKLWNDPNHDSSHLKQVRASFANYEAWVESYVIEPLEQHPSVKLHRSFFPGDLSVRVELPGVGFPLGIVGLNSSWLHYKDGCEKRLAIPLEQFHAALGPGRLGFFDDVVRSILMMHHPIDWQHPDFKVKFESGVYPPSRFDLCVHGHMHESRSVSYAVGGGRLRANFQAPSIFGLEGYGTKTEGRIFGYAFGEIRANAEVRVWPLLHIPKSDGDHKFEPDRLHYRWTDTEPSEGVQYHDYVKLRGAEVELKPDA